MVPLAVIAALRLLVLAALVDVAVRCASGGHEVSGAEGWLFFIAIFGAVPVLVSQIGPPDA